MRTEEPLERNEAVHALHVEVHDDPRRAGVVHRVQIGLLERALCLRQAERRRRRLCRPHALCLQVVPPARGAAEPADVREDPPVAAAHVYDGVAGAEAGAHLEHAVDADLRRRHVRAHVALIGDVPVVIVAEEAVGETGVVLLVERGEQGRTRGRGDGGGGGGGGRGRGGCDDVWCGKWGGHWA